jgi:hypothetical protein
MPTRSVGHAGALGRSEAKVGIASQTERPIARTLRQIAFSYSLDPPGNPSNQELLVIGTRGFTEELQVPDLQFRDRFVS